MARTFVDADIGDCDSTVIIKGNSARSRDAAHDGAAVFHARTIVDDRARARNPAGGCRGIGRVTGNQGHGLRAFEGVVLGNCCANQKRSATIEGGHSTCVRNPCAAIPNLER